MRLRVSRYAVTSKWYLLVTAKLKAKPDGAAVPAAMRLVGNIPTF
jgi:hypothetical protein